MNNHGLSKLQFVYFIYTVVTLILTALLTFLIIKAPVYLFRQCQDWAQESGPGGLAVILIVPFVLILPICFIASLLLVSLCNFFMSFIGLIKISKTKDSKDYDKLFYFLSKRRMIGIKKRWLKENLYFKTDAELKD